jgi:signal transduction histidine kinase
MSGIARLPALARFLQYFGTPSQEDGAATDGLRDISTLIVGAALFVMLDLALNAGSPRPGSAGPDLVLVAEIATDVSLVLLVRFPRVVAGVVVLSSMIMLLADYRLFDLITPGFSASPVTIPRAAPIIIVWLMLHEDRRVSYVVTGALALLASRPWTPSWTTMPFGLLSTLGPALGALYFNARRELVQSLRDRAERAEREQVLLSERARTEERRRLAEEMHDVVTHQLSLMVLNAGALGMSSAEPPVRKAAEDIRHNGTQALNELRDLIGVLRDGNGDPVPVTATMRVEGAVHPEGLAAESTSVGVPVVELDVTGGPDDVSPTVARTAYRVVQEALTNVRKHAPGAEVRIKVHYLPDRVSIRVLNSAPRGVADPVLVGSGSGSGLAALEQRVELVGGRLTTGHTVAGGFQVDARLPAFVPTSEGG